MLWAGKAHGTGMDRNVQRDFDQPSPVKIFPDEFPYHTADAQADTGKFDQKVHVGDLQKMSGLDVVSDHILIDILPGYIFSVQEHDGGCGEYLSSSCILREL